MRMDYAYRRNGTRGFVQALPLGRDPGQAKVLAFTADAIRAKLPKTEFLAVTEIEPRPQENPRHRFVTGLLEEREIPVVPLARLAEWAQRMRPALLAQRASCGTDICARSTEQPLQKFFVPGFQALLHASHELVARWRRPRRGDRN